MAAIDYMKLFTREEIRQTPEDIIFIDYESMNKKIMIDGEINLESDDWKIFISDQSKFLEVETAFHYLIEEYERQKRIRS